MGIVVFVFVPFFCFSLLVLVWLCVIEIEDFYLGVKTDWINADRPEAFGSNSARYIG